MKNQEKKSEWAENNYDLRKMIKPEHLAEMDAMREKEKSEPKEPDVDFSRVIDITELENCVMKNYQNIPFGGQFEIIISDRINYIDDDDSYYTNIIINFAKLCESDVYAIGRSLNELDIINTEGLTEEEVDDFIKEKLNKLLKTIDNELKSEGRIRLSKCYIEPHSRFDAMVSSFLSKDFRPKDIML